VQLPHRRGSLHVSPVSPEPPVGWQIPCAWRRLMGLLIQSLDRMIEIRKDTNDNLLQKETLAYGLLAATVAHELRAPVAAIQS
jgi:signal transduction histidine kinase